MDISKMTNNELKAVGSYIDEIIENSRFCKHCEFRHEDSDGKLCFFASECIAKDFMYYKDKKCERVEVTNREAINALGFIHDNLCAGCLTGGCPEREGCKSVKSIAHAILALEYNEQMGATIKGKTKEGYFLIEHPATPEVSYFTGNAIVNKEGDPK